MSYYSIELLRFEHKLIGLSIDNLSMFVSVQSGQDLSTISS